MPLKHQLDSLDGVDTAIQQFYQKDEGTGKFFLQVEGMVAKSVVNEFRENNIRLSKELEGFKGVDVAEYTRLKNLESTFKGKPDEAAVEKLVQERTTKMKEDFDGKVNALTTENGVMKSQLEVLVIDNAVRAAAIKTGVRPEAMDDVLLRAKTIFRFEKGAAVPYDNKNQPIYGKDGTNHMTTEEWVSGLKKSAPHLFPASAGGGASGPGARGTVGNGNLTATQKIAAGLESRGG